MGRPIERARLRKRVARRVIKTPAQPAPSAMFSKIGNLGACRERALLKCGTKVCGFEVPDTVRFPLGGIPMNTTVIHHYRCPDHFADLKLKGQLSDDTGYFQFGQ